MRILWLSGWASDLGDFLPELEQAFPDQHHRTLSWSQLFSAPVEELTAALPEVDRVVAWSQGAQLLLRHGAASASTSTIPPTFLVGPAVDFCRSQTGWSVALLRTMARAVVRAPEQVLRDFVSKLGASADVQGRWLRRALEIDPVLLAAGLMELVEPIDLADLPTEFFSRLTILQGEEDLIVTPANSAAFWSGSALSPITLSGAGHWVLSAPILSALREQFRVEA